MKKKIKGISAEEGWGNKFRQEKIDVLFGGNIIEHIRKMGNMEMARLDYFYWVSSLWRAIQEHISKANDCVLIKRENKIRWEKMHGPCIYLRRTHSYADSWRDIKDKRIPAKVFAMVFDVEYIPKSQIDHKWPLETYHKTYDINVPIKLELNFTKKGFNKWITELRDKRNSEEKEQDIAELKRLQARLKT